MLSKSNKISRRILVADDDPVMMRVVSRILVEAGYQIVAGPLTPQDIAKQQ